MSGYQLTLARSVDHLTIRAETRWRASAAIAQMLAEEDALIPARRVLQLPCPVAEEIALGLRIKAAKQEAASAAKRVGQLCISSGCVVITRSDVGDPDPEYRYH